MKKKIISLLITTALFSTPAFAGGIEYIDYGVPNINSSFKTYEEDSAIYKYSNSAQSKFLKQWGYIDEQGFYRCSAEPDFNVYDDYYLVAMGSYYTNTIGDKFRVFTDTGKMFYVCVADFKADAHTNSTNQYSVRNKDIIEFVVNPASLNPIVKQWGTCNVYMPLNGSITHIEKMSFDYN